jgi:hypothetical protein
MCLTARAREHAIAYEVALQKALRHVLRSERFALASRCGGSFVICNQPPGLLCRLIAAPRLEFNFAIKTNGQIRQTSSGYTG